MSNYMKPELKSDSPYTEEDLRVAFREREHWATECSTKALAVKTAKSILDGAEKAMAEAEAKFFSAKKKFVKVASNQGKE